MPESPPIDPSKTKSVDPRPRSNFAAIASAAVAILALICSFGVLSITSENQCNDRRDRRILQQPNVWLEPDHDKGTIFLVNSGPGAALIKEYSEIYKGSPLPHPAVGDDYQHFASDRLFSGEREWAFGMSSLPQLQNAAFLCAGRITEGCLHVRIDLDFLQPNFVLSPGQRFPILSIRNLDEIKKRVSEDEFLVWISMFGSAARSDDIDLRIEYCPLSREFGPCRTISKNGLSPFPELPACKAGLEALWPSWRTWYRGA
jgi:hypothetical protein